jgi:hypothetical protein
LFSAKKNDFFNVIVIVIVLRQRAKFNALLIRSARFACCVVATELGGPLGPPSERAGLPRRSKAWPARSLPPPRRVRGSSRGGHDADWPPGEDEGGWEGSPRVALWDPQGVDPHPPPGQGTGSYPELHAPGPAMPLSQIDTHTHANAIGMAVVSYHAGVLARARKNLPSGGRQEAPWARPTDRSWGGKRG